MARHISRLSARLKNKVMSSGNQPRKRPSSSNAASEQLHYKRVVVKAGTSVLTDSQGSGRINQAAMAKLVRQICRLRQEDGAEVVLVSSGAIAAGRQVLRQEPDQEIQQEPGRQHFLERDIPSRQVLAAMGQGQLIHNYAQLFDTYNVRVAQALLTINDLADRQSYLNVRNTLMSLLALDVVPILNENDVVAVDEIGEVFGDNDRLSALVANLIDADLLIILTDTDGLYTADPHLDPTASLIPVVEQVDETIEIAAGRHQNPWARGGMPTKIDAARLVTSAGIAMVICNGRADDAVLRATRGQAIGTRFSPAGERMEARKRWMLSRIRDSHWGEIVVDGGAADALLNRHVSLLPAGIKDIRGEFHRGDIIYIADESGHRIACGISNYTAADIVHIRGVRSDSIFDILGYHYGQEVVHRNNLTLL